MHEGYTLTPTHATPWITIPPPLPGDQDSLVDHDPDGRWITGRAAPTPTR